MAHRKCEREIQSHLPHISEKSNAMNAARDAGIDWENVAPCYRDKYLTSYSILDVK